MQTDTSQMKPSLYLETTIPSYLVAGIASDVITVAHQEATKRWWIEERENYQLYVSPVVDDEIGRGNPDLAKERQMLVAGLPRLEVTIEVTELAGELHAFLNLPPAAMPDAFHLALACHWQIDYLLTWNLKHIASGHVRHRLARLHDTNGAAIPTICTPEELLDWSNES